MSQSRKVRHASRPDFLGIGVQKAATNWVWHNLRRHPGIWTPPVKELHYFDRSPEYPSPSHLATARLGRRLLGAEPHNVEFRRLFGRKLASMIVRGQRKDLAWRIRHFTGKYDDQWYLSLFREGGDRIKGEITPSYSILDLEDVRKIRDLLPDVKLILILRNPIDRAWSHLRFRWTMGDFDDDAMQDLDRIRQFIDSPAQVLRSDYLRTLDIWRSCFPDRQFFIGFYDDIREHPQDLLDRLYDFLGADPLPREEQGDVQEKQYVSAKRDIPEEILRYLTEKYRPEIEKLSTMLGGRAAKWLAETEKAG